MKTAKVFARRETLLAPKQLPKLVSSANASRGGSILGTPRTPTNCMKFSTYEQGLQKQNSPKGKGFKFFESYNPAKLRVEFEIQPVKSL